MSQNHFVFGLVVSVFVVAVGVGISTLGAAGLHLVAVGIGIFVVTLSSRYKSLKAGSSSNGQVPPLFNGVDSNPA